MECAVQDFRNLKVWEKSHQFTLQVYRVTATFPKEEMYGLISQIRRACTSIPTNIAEGCVRGSDADFKRFLYISLGSTSETEYHILLARDLGYLADHEYAQLNQEITEIKQMLITLIKKLKANSL
jgi:four helix bundle protein